MVSENPMQILVAEQMSIKSWYYLKNWHSNTTEAVVQLKWCNKVESRDHWTLSSHHAETVASEH